MADGAAAWKHEPSPWGKRDLLALAVWSLVVAAFFWEIVGLKRALFYFDITEINYPYRDFFARELRAGRFSRWCPELHCGLPLYSESQAGYLHPLKYLLYPWLETWQALGLDVVVSIWLTGVGTYGWLRRHVGPAGALTGAAVLGLNGYTWGHLIHTSMINALTSVPFVIWSLEAAWQAGRFRPLVPGAFALACQVFAGHGQDTLLTSALIGLYALFRAATETGLRARLQALAMAVAVVGLAGALAAVQWIPSTELLGRSARAGGLSWDELTYGSWSPELLPALLVREAYGTRARGTDWLNGFYQYHEMNAYLGAVAMALAVVGGAAYRDRWVAFWVLMVGIGGTLMLGRFTFLFDVAHRIPIVGSTRIPMRFQLWVDVAVAALAAVGVDRLARPGTIRLRAPAGTIAAMAILSVPILVYNYTPVWTEAARWNDPYHHEHLRWLTNELLVACGRTLLIATAGWFVAVNAARSVSPQVRGGLAWLFPLLVLADLLGAHAFDVPTVAPDYWTSPPPSARVLKADPRFIRLVGVAKLSAGEPGYASQPVDFFAVRDTLDWSLPLAWGLASAGGASPVVPRRRLDAIDHIRAEWGRLDIESVSHVVLGVPDPSIPARGLRAGSATIYANAGALSRARLVGRPAYAENEAQAIALIHKLGPAIRERPVIEDPARPLPETAEASGTAAITRDLPEHVEVATECATPAYLVLADAFDPGWSATVDGRPAPIRPAYLAFRAVYLPAGKHAVVFRYRPAGFAAGFAVSGLGTVLAAGLWLGKLRKASDLTAEHAQLASPRCWPLWGLAVIGVIVLCSIPQFGHSGQVGFQRRWEGTFHRFTWASGIEAMHRK